MSTHYTVGGMPLAFTQEDFLVVKSICFDLIVFVAIIDQTKY